ncbi:tripartite ATP-independent transporter DctP family solute receptor [Lysinibacillus composti]|uniref:TRAP transporter substrate-binding protein n=1 Tax=Lysinibacillus composti TaxID=720633 RepID=A0A3N9UDD2_9BACI|nr:TRAP transporter substrate-binding protein [Lysinibacillus composti]MBM7609326.1 tripartite ATP-independent transporter DctP family solute receptor [Lysinibacillus composti]RQW74271.1 TRAP transporter substrate-binding protein [Lysinibacillus composti]
MKKLLIFFSIVMCSILLVACGSSSKDDTATSTSSEAKEIVYRFGHAAPEGDPGDLLSEKMAEGIDQATDGQVTIEVFPGAQLGGEVEMVEQVRAGTIDFAFVTGGALSNFVEDVAFLDMPFLFDDLDHAQRVLKGEVGDQLKAKAEEKGLKILTFMNYGIANISNNKHDVYGPEDLKGLKLRTLENEIFMDTYRALGADPVPIPYPELYTSIQQGVVDGTDPLNVTMTGGKLYEVTKHLSKVGISYRAGVLVMNLDKYDELSDDLRGKLDTVVGESDDYYHSTIYPEYEKSAEKIMTDNGVKIIEQDEIDMEAFRKAVQPVYDKHESKFAEYISKIKE